MKKEILIFGIICLFIGVGIQPAFAVEISNNSPSENIEDCNCKPINDLPIIGSIINFILLKKGNIPEVSEKSKELLDKSNTGDWESFCNNFIQFIEDLEDLLFASFLIILLYWISIVICYPYIPW